MSNKYKYDVIWDEHVKDYILTDDAIKYYKREEDSRFYCPGCKKVLVFVNAEMRKKHFRHNGNLNKEDKCLTQLSPSNLEYVKNYCNESIIHKNFKTEFEKLMNNKIPLIIPQYSISLNDHIPLNNFVKKNRIDGEIDETHIELKKIINQRRVLIKNVEMEKHQNTINDLNNLIIPDLVITTIDLNTKEKIEYNVEIVVTNDIDNIKYKKIIANKKNCLQINIKDIKEEKHNNDYYIKNFNKKARYIYTEEVNLEEEYIDLNIKYDKKIKKENEMFIENKDRFEFSIVNGIISVKENSDSECVFCNKKVIYKNNNFKHVEESDFLKCLKYLKYKRNIDSFYENLLYSLQEKNKINFLFKGLKTKINERGSLIINNNYIGCIIDLYDLDIKNIKSNVHKKNIDLQYLINFKEKNIINNMIEFESYLSDKECKDKFIINKNNTCFDCNKDNFRHHDYCNFNKNNDSFQEYKKNIINNFIEKTMPEKLIELKINMIKDNVFVKNLLNILNALTNKEFNFVIKEISKNNFIISFPGEKEIIEVIRVEVYSKKPSLNINGKDINLSIKYDTSDFIGKFTEVESKIENDDFLHNSNFSTFLKKIIFFNSISYKKQVEFVKINSIVKCAEELSLSFQDKISFNIINMDFKNMNIAQFYINRKSESLHESNFKDFNIIYEIDLNKGVLHTEYISKLNNFYNKPYFLLSKIKEILPSIVKIIKKKEISVSENIEKLSNNSWLINYYIKNTKHTLFIGDNDELSKHHSSYINIIDYLSKDISSFEDFKNHVKNIIKFPSYTKERLYAEKQKILFINNNKKNRKLNVFKNKKNKSYNINDPFANILNMQNQLKYIYKFALIKDVDVKNIKISIMKPFEFKTRPVSKIIIMKVIIKGYKILLLPYPKNKNIGIFEQLILLMNDAFKNKESMDSASEYKYLMFYENKSGEEFLTCNSSLIPSSLTAINTIQSNKNNFKDLRNFQTLPFSLHEVFLMSIINEGDVDYAVDLYKILKKRNSNLKMTNKSYVINENNFKKFMKKI